MTEEEKEQYRLDLQQEQAEQEAIQAEQEAEAKLDWQQEQAEQEAIQAEQEAEAKIDWQQEQAEQEAEAKLEWQQEQAKQEAEAKLEWLQEQEEKYKWGWLRDKKFKKQSNIEKESSLEVKRDSERKEINELKEKIKKINSSNEAEREEQQSIIDQRELHLFNLDEEIKSLKSNEKKVEETINFIKKLPSKHLGILKKTLVKRIKFFNCVGTISLIITAVAFFGYFICLMKGLQAPDNAVAYFTNVFFIIFPTVVAFTSFRQSNLKSVELEKIDEKLLNSNYLIASLKAIQRISSVDDTNKKILSSIDKLIDSILNNGDEKENEDEKSLTSSELSTILKNMSSITKA